MEHPYGMWKITKESEHSETEKKQNTKKKPQNKQTNKNQHTFGNRRILVTKSYTKSFVESSS